MHWRLFPNRNFYRAAVEKIASHALLPAQGGSPLVRSRWPGCLQGLVLRALCQCRPGPITASPASGHYEDESHAHDRDPVQSAAAPRTS